MATKPRPLLALGGAALGAIGLALLFRPKAPNQGHGPTGDDGPVFPLVDAEERAQRFPGTFEMPPRSVREDLGEGDFAKIIFMTPQGSGERLWVKVQEGLGQEGVYLGTLDNDGVLLPMRHGQLVAFGPEHVIDVMRPPQGGARW